MRFALPFLGAIFFSMAWLPAQVSAPPAENKSPTAPIQKLNPHPSPQTPVGDASSGSATSEITPAVNLAFEAEEYVDQFGTQTEGGSSVGYINSGDWLRFDRMPLDGATGFGAIVSSKTKGGIIEIRANAPEGTLLGSVAVPGTGGWHNFTEVLTNITGASKDMTIYLVFTDPDGSRGYLLNIDRFYFITDPEFFVPPPPKVYKGINLFDKSLPPYARSLVQQEDLSDFQRPTWGWTTGPEASESAWWNFNNLDVRKHARLQIVVSCESPPAGTELEVIVSKDANHWLTAKVPVDWSGTKTLSLPLIEMRRQGIPNLAEIQRVEIRRVPPGDGSPLAPFTLQIVDIGFFAVIPE